MKSLIWGNEMLKQVQHDREHPERILLETDSPVSYQGKVAKPKDVRISLREVARLKGVDLTVVAEQTTANASLLFQIALDL